MDRAVSPQFFTRGLAEADPEVMKSLTQSLNASKVRSNS